MYTQKIAYKSLFLLFFTTIFMISCCDKESDYLSLSIDKVEMSAEGGQTPFLISTNTKWSISSTESWVRLSSSSGSGETEVNLTLSPNTTRESRNTSITITAGSEVKTIPIVQQMSYLTLSTYELTFDPEGTPRQVVINANHFWTAHQTEESAWCDIDITKAQPGETTVTLTPLPYTERVLRGVSYISFSCFNTVVQLAIRQEINNENPSPPVLLRPLEGDIHDIPVAFAWSPATDPDGDVLSYDVYISEDGNEWEEVASGISETSYLLTSRFLDSYTTYYWKVVARDDFDGRSESIVTRFRTGEHTYYQDGEVILHDSFTASDAQAPVHLVVLGDGFIDLDYAVGGTFDRAANQAIESFFSIEPYPTYRDHFSVYKIAAYSQERGATVLNDFDHYPQKKQVCNTVFNCRLDGGRSTYIDCNDKEVFRYVKNIPGMTDEELKRTTVLLMINLEVYAGTTIMWHDGRSIAMCPMGDTFDEIVCHEAAGHGFGRLLDEYINHPTSSLPSKERNEIISYRNGDPWRFGANLSLTNATSEVHWKHYLKEGGYEAVDLFEGGYMYGLGVWRPEYNSCMNNNIPYFNAPSREAIVRRIMEISGKPFDYAAYYSGDHIRSYSETAGRSVSRSLFTTPLAPPVLRK